MKLWWRRELQIARERADAAELRQHQSTVRRYEAERVDRRARELEDSLNQELLRNGFADALRAAFGGVQ
ncbi:DUF7620 family protein [Gordonia sp. SL306]|uniref:DUF7620 family protein n=1 Tax=Gordonia sp. SL306 TaxID=2995145 RepID=UPI00226EF3E5|nr:hypothetical protein [Gordonia sp. SL306]WAC54972.1 hypothetical protein OVA31_20395 [Gordonia sp. SL306]